MFDVDTLQPYGPYVLARRLPSRQTTLSGLVLPEETLNKNLQCEVISVGCGENVNGTFVHSGLEPGDIVIIRQFDGRQLGVNREVLLVHHDMIEAKVLDKPWPESLGGSDGETLSKVH